MGIAGTDVGVGGTIGCVYPFGWCRVAASRLDLRATLMRAVRGDGGGREDVRRFATNDGEGVAE